MYSHCKWKPRHRSKKALQLMTTMLARPQIPIHAFMSAITSLDAGDTWQSPHVPDEYNVYSLPNVTCDLVACCFSSAPTGMRNTNAIVHVLSKAWPVRCSIRNFNEIIRNYIRTNLGIYTFLLSLLHCTLAGRYLHTTTPVSFETCRRLYSYFRHDKPTQHEFAEWLTNDNQQLLFVAIKEYMVFSVENVPGLRQVLSKCYSWAEFSKTVIYHAESVRQMINRNVENGDLLFNNVAERIAPMRAFKSKLHSTYTVQMYTAALSTLRSCFFSDKHVYNAPLRCKLQLLASSMDNDAPTLMGALNFSTEVIDRFRCCSSGSPTLSARRDMESLLQSLPFSDAFLLGELLSACIFNMCVKTTPLPAIIRKQQEATLAKSPRNTDMLLCMCCRQLRAFVVDDSTASKNKWACGSNKVLLDDATGRLYCGRRTEKHTGHASCDASAGTTRRNYWKYQQNMMCRYSELLVVPMIGTLLEHFGVLYMLCPVCLCTMVLKPSRFDGGPLCCIHCQYTHSALSFSRCFHCYSECNGARYEICGRAVVVCKSCEKDWMHGECLSRMSQSMVHQAINERWRKSRILAELNEQPPC